MSKSKSRKRSAQKTWNIDIQLADRKYKLKLKNLTKTLKDILLDLDAGQIPKSIRELSVVFVSNSQIKKLNKLYRGKNKITDVLSFSQIEGAGLPSLTKSLGDIVIALKQAEAQAPKYGNDFEQEILRLLIHGTLHLFGYDHENVSMKEAKRMQQMEDRLFLKFKNQARNVI